MADTTRYGTTHAGHEIELDFDRSKIVLNQARLLVDGDVVDQGQPSSTATSTSRRRCPTGPGRI